MSTRARFFALSLAFALLGGCGQGGVPAGDPPLAGADIGGDFELIDSHGKTVRWTDFAGKYRMVYFGFTYCPDACPTDLARSGQGLREFEKTHPDRGAKIQPIFISVDPGRDTPKVVGEFISHFHPRLVGLTGSAEQVEAAANVFRVFFEKGDVAKDGSYMMNHSTVTYLFDPDGNPLATIPTDQGPEAVAAELAKWVS